jgi:hypothetical protein
MAWASVREWPPEREMRVTAPAGNVRGGFMVPEQMVRIV